MSSLRAEDIIIKSVIFEDGQIIITMTPDSANKLFEMINFSNSANALSLVLGGTAILTLTGLKLGVKSSIIKKRQYLDIEPRYLRWI